VGGESLTFDGEFVGFFVFVGLWSSLFGRHLVAGMWMVVVVGAGRFLMFER